MYFTIGDATYAYDMIGKGSPLVLLHGFTSNRSTWSELITKWKDNFKIITVDLPGHGDTRVNSPRTMEACCHDLAKLFAHLNLSSFHLVGYSLGGRTALSFAMLYPSFLLSLTLESSSPGLNTKSEQKVRQKQDELLADRVIEEGIEEFINYWENISLFKSHQTLPRNIQQRIRKERLSQSRTGLAQSLRWMGTGVQPSWWEDLYHFNSPVLLIVGALDQKFVKINKQMKNLFQCATLKIVRKAGHTVHIEEPNQFFQIVIDFIKKVESNNI